MSLEERVAGIEGILEQIGKRLTGLKWNKPFSGGDESFITDTKCYSSIHDTTDEVNGERALIADVWIDLGKYTINYYIFS